MRFRGELGLFGSVRRFAWRVGADVVLTFRNAYGSAWGSKNRSCTGARVTFHQPRPTLRGLFEVRNASRIATHVLHTIHRLVYQGSVSFIYQNLIDPPPARSGSESRRPPRTKGPPNHSNVQVIAMVAGREPRCAISHSHRASATPPRCGRRRTGGVLGWARAGPRSLSRFQQAATPSRRLSYTRVRRGPSLGCVEARESNGQLERRSGGSLARETPAFVLQVGLVACGNLCSRGRLGGFVGAGEVDVDALFDRGDA